MTDSERGDSERPEVPLGLQRLMRLAEVDEQFRVELLQRRGALADAAGITLNPSERAVLEAAPREQLAAMIASLPAPSPQRRSFLKDAALAALAIVAAQALTGCRCEPAKALDAGAPTVSTVNQDRIDAPQPQKKKLTSFGHEGEGY